MDDDLPELPELPEGVRVPDDMGAWWDDLDDLTPTPSQTGTVAVIAAIDPPAGSPYVTEVQPSDDVVIRLPLDKAHAYAHAVLAAAHRAHYLTAVFAQAYDMFRRGRKPIGHDEAVDLARFMLGQLLDDLPDIDDEATAPLRFLAVTMRDGRAMVRVSLPPHTEPLTGWTFLEARQHAHHVLDQAQVSQLDTAYRTTVAGNFGAGEQRGRAAVQDLGRFYPTDADEANAAAAAGYAPPPRVPFVKPEPRVPGPPPGAKPAGGKRRRGKR